MMKTRTTEKPAHKPLVKIPQFSGADTTPKPVCDRCYCSFCLCGVKEGPFFEVDREARIEWYGR